MLCSTCGAWSAAPDRCSACGVAGPAAPAERNPYAPPSAQAFPQVQQTQGFQPAPYGYGYPPVWPPQRPFASVRGLATSLYVLFGVTALTALFVIATSLMRVSGVADWVDDASQVDESKAEDMENLLSLTIVVFLAALLATGIVFLVWFHRARKNIELFSPIPPALSTGWAIASWFTPLVNFWFPKQIAHDIWKASDPQAPLRGGSTPGRHALLWPWWLLWSAAWLCGWYGVLADPSSDDEGNGYAYVDIDYGKLQTVDIVTAVSALLFIAAGALAAVFVWKITTFQHQRAAGAGPLAQQPFPGQAFPGQPVTNPWAPPAPSVSLTKDDASQSDTPRS